MGNGLVHGKIPYRDLFEHKGPIVYFVTAFCHLFPDPNTMFLIIEIFCMSLFFFFAYKIFRKALNNFCSLLAILFLAFAVFTCWCRMFSGAPVEEFCLPIFSYFLLCWLEFLTEKKSWTWTRSLFLGLCFGILFWVKFTMFYFIITPIIIWFIISLYRRQFHNVFINILCMVAGILIITAPILLFFAIYKAIDDLFYVYLFINLSSYDTTSMQNILSSFMLFFEIGPTILFFILWGIISFSIIHWKEPSGWLLLIAFIINLALITYTCKGLTYYYGQIFPYAILGITNILKLITTKINFSKLNQSIKISIYILSLIIILGLCIPCSPSTQEWGRNENEYAPLVYAKIFNQFKDETGKEATFICYDIGDHGFYNAAEVTPSVYFYAKNFFSKNNFPDMFKSFDDYITNKKIDFIITTTGKWNSEKQYLEQYYQPYTGDAKTSTFAHKRLQYHKYEYINFILLIKK